MRLSIFEDIQILELVRLQALRDVCSVDGVHVWRFLQLMLRHLQGSVGECRVKAHMTDVGEDEADREEWHKDR